MRETKKGDKQTKIYQKTFSLTAKSGVLLGLEQAKAYTLEVQRRTGGNFNAVVKQINRIYKYLDTYIHSVESIVIVDNRPQINYSLRYNEQEDPEEIGLHIENILDSPLMQDIFKRFILPSIVKQRKPPATEPEDHEGQYEFKVSGHIGDQILKPGKNYKDGQLELPFYQIRSSTVKREVIKEQGDEPEVFIEGFYDLTAAQHRFIETLAKLVDRNKHSGQGKQLSKTDGIPKIYITPYQLAKEHSAKGNPSGRDIELVLQYIEELRDRKFHIRFTREFTDRETNEKITEKIEEYQPLIYEGSFERIVRDADTNKIKDHTKEDIIRLNSIFTKDIGGKYLLYPGDLIRRTEIAYGSRRIPKSVEDVRTYLAREVSNSRLTGEIYLHNAMKQFDMNSMKAHRKKRARKNVLKAFDTCKKLRLVEDYEIVKGATGEEKITWKLNKDWTK